MSDVIEFNERLRKALMKVIQENLAPTDSMIVEEGGMRFVYYANRKDMLGNIGRWDFIEET